MKKNKFEQHNLPEERVGKIIFFQSRKIRRIWYKNEWFYSVTEIGK